MTVIKVIFTIYVPSDASETRTYEP